MLFQTRDGPASFVWAPDCSTLQRVSCMRLQLCVARQVAALAKMEWLSRAALPARFGDPGRHHRRRNGGAGARRLPAGRRGAARRHRGLRLARCHPGAAAARGAQHHDALERCRRVLTSNLVLGAAKRTCAGLSLRPHFMARRPLLQRLVSSRPRTRPRGAPPRPSPTTARVPRPLPRPAPIPHRPPSSPAV